MTSDIPKFSLLFPHNALRYLFFSRGVRLYEQLSQSPNIEIKRLWNTLAKEMNVIIKDNPKCFLQSLEGNQELFLITLPDPVEPQEVKYIGLVYKNERSFLRKEKSAHRYFLLELGEPVVQNKFYLCEWNAVDLHKNHGEVKNNSSDAFSSAIQSIISRGKIDKEFVVSKDIGYNAENKSEKEDYSEENDPSTEEEEIEEIITKWKETITPDLYNKAGGEIEQFQSFFLGYIQILSLTNANLHRNFIDVKEKVKNTLRVVGIRSLVLGLEFGTLGEKPSDRINQVSDLSDRARKLLLATGTAVLSTIMPALGKAIREGNTSTQDVDQILKRLQNAQIGCFRIGVKLSEEVKVQREKEERLNEENTVYDNVQTSSDDFPEEKSEKTGVSDTFKKLAEIAMTDPDPLVRQQAQAGIKELWPGGLEKFDEFFFQMIEGLRDPKIRNISLQTLILWGELVLPELKMYLKDPDPELRKLVTQIIIEIEKDRPKP